MFSFGEAVVAFVPDTPARKMIKDRKKKKKICSPEREESDKTGTETIKGQP